MTVVPCGRFANHKSQITKVSKSLLFIILPGCKDADEQKKNRVFLAGNHSNSRWLENFESGQLSVNKQNKQTNKQWYYLSLYQTYIHISQ